MEPVSVILGALAAGALKGTGEAATTAVGDAYRSLKQLISRRFKGKPQAELALERHAADPTDWEPLEEALVETGASSDSEVLEAAQSLLDLLRHQGTGKYTISINNSEDIQVGDGTFKFSTHRSD